MSYINKNIFYTTKGILDLRTMSVRLSLGTTLYERDLGYASLIHVYIEDVQGRIILLFFLMDFPKLVIIGISVIIDYGLYGWALLYP